MNHPMKHALVAGAHGTAGHTLVSYLAKRPDWKVTGLARRSLPDSDGIPIIAIDLLDRAACSDKLSSLKDVTHVFFAAYQERQSFAEQVAPNLAMLVNLVEVIERVASSLHRVVLLQGAKYYGVHLGPFKTPAKEDDPRHMPPNFYYDQEDYLRKRGQNASWTWTAVRPGTIFGYSIGSPMNLAMVLAVYASISRELGLPLRFPGTFRAYRALRALTDAELLAKAMVWAATEPCCASEAFNITNGEPIRWENLWPGFAHIFDMEWALPQKIRLGEVMADKAPLWDSMTKKYGLRPDAYADIVRWSFGDYIFNYNYDVLLDASKARRFGFAEHVDNEEMFRRLFDDFRGRRIIP